MLYQETTTKIREISVLGSQNWMLRAVYIVLSAIALTAMAEKPDQKEVNAMGERRILEIEDTQIEFHIGGSGPTVVLLASLGRPASDFETLASDLHAAGFQTIAVEAPGIGASSLPSSPIGMAGLADMVAEIIEKEAPEEKIVAIGHAFGNRLARSVAAFHPDKVRGVALIAAGGKMPIADKAGKSLIRCFQLDLPPEERLEDIRYAFFAGDNPIPQTWVDGWYPETASVQIHATQSTPSEEWWDAGGVPILVVQAMQDVIAPPEHTVDLLEQDYGDRVTAVRIEGAGHALLPEKPKEISEAVIKFLSAVGGS